MKQYHTWLSTRLSQETDARIDVSGPMNVRELEALKRYVEMQLGWALEERPRFICERCRERVDDTFAGQCFHCFTQRGDAASNCVMASLRQGEDPK